MWISIIQKSAKNTIWVVSKNRGVSPKMDGYTMENHIKMDDLGVPLFLETPIWVVQEKLGGWMILPGCL